MQLLHPFNGQDNPGKPVPKVKPVWVLVRQEMMGWGFGMQCHQLDHMQTICTSLQTENHTNTALPFHFCVVA